MRHPAPSQSTEFVVVGRVTGSWGTAGELKVEVFTDFPQRYAPGSVLYLDGRAARVVRSRQHKGSLVVKLDIVNDRTLAQSLRGKDLTIHERDLRTLPGGSYYHFQIIGIGVWTEDGEYLGDVKEILSTGSNDVYLVRGGGDKDVLVPSIEGVVLEVHLDQNRMVVRLPEGLR